MRQPIKLPFVKDGMTFWDIKLAADTLHHILTAFDDHQDNPEEFTLRVRQVRDRWEI